MLVVLGKRIQMYKNNNNVRGTSVSDLPDNTPRERERQRGGKERQNVMKTQILLNKVTHYCVDTVHF